MNERWKDIPGYVGLYRVSDQGRVYSENAGTIVRDARVGAGYRGVGLSVLGVRKNFYVHRLVAEAFLKNPENKADVNHKDGDKTNNAASNLEWVTRAENNLHSRRVLKHWTGPPKRPVVCIETGKVYDCAKSAAADIGASRSGIDLVCRGINDSIYNLHFKFKED